MSVKEAVDRLREELLLINKEAYIAVARVLQGIITKNKGIAEAGLKDLEALKELGSDEINRAFDIYKSKVIELFEKGRLGSEIKDYYMLKIQRPFTLVVERITHSGKIKIVL